MTGFANEHLSFSRLNRFERCPLSYRLHYIDKVESEPNTAMRFGKVIHAVLERLVRVGDARKRRIFFFGKRISEAHGLTA